MFQSTFPGDFYSTFQQSSPMLGGFGGFGGPLGGFDTVPDMSSCGVCDLCGGPEDMTPSVLTSPDVLTAGPTLPSGGDTVGTLWADVFEAPDHFLIAVDVPGFKKHNVNITLQDDNLLRVRADRLFPQPDPDTQVRRLERDFGRFQRTLRLPRSAETSKMEAKMEDGQLKIRIQKKEAGLRGQARLEDQSQSSGSQIKVESGSQQEPK